jgi:hypothetical protein
METETMEMPTPTTTMTVENTNNTENPREQDYKNAISEIENILKNYNLTLSAEVTVTTNGNYPRVFLTEVPTETEA